MMRPLIAPGQSIPVLFSIQGTETGVDRKTCAGCHMVGHRNRDKMGGGSTRPRPGAERRCQSRNPL